MARHSRALHPFLLLLLACALFQSSYSSRPVVHSADEPARHGDGPTTQVRRPTEEEAAGVHREADANGAASAVGDGGAVGSEQWKKGAPVAQQVMPRSKLPPQVPGGEVEDSVARPSCRSNDVRITCL
ncbi:uncharacterized protein LOC124697233 [Lolium rigidum]|uniref:uncharacterized protein LOC124697233 n=1 Tax=Lolium rigidum TaxID=89674 RepID=UPI001F5C0C89|nr:uncharacterized protein LOC124697233 [Lolium rigidum]